MGINLIITAGKRSFSRRISRADWELLSTLRSLSPDEIALLVDVPDLDTTVHVPRIELLKACEQVLAVIRENAHVIPYTYQYSRGATPTLYSTGGTSGIRFPGDERYFYHIQAGFNECKLERWRVKSNLGVHVETRDIRDLTELFTSNMGTIRIRRSRARTDVKRMVSDLSGFLSEQKSREVVKCVS